MLVSIQKFNFFCLDLRVCHYFEVYNGRISGNVEMAFLTKKYQNQSTVYQKCRISTFGGVCFLRKNDLVNIFLKQIIILDLKIIIEYYSNLKNLNPVFLVKILTKKNISQKPYQPNSKVPFIRLIFLLNRLHSPFEGFQRPLEPLSSYISV